jgi:hypothetical protein
MLTVRGVGHDVVGLCRGICIHTYRCKPTAFEDPSRSCQ